MDSVSHYRILQPLGEGGMGEVYAGFDETLKRRVALKAIRAEHRLSEQTKTRFLREAQILSQLDHPNICRIYDYVEGADSDWLVLELVEGRSLYRASKLDLTYAAKLKIAVQIAEVLVSTHAANVVHRDLKPSNVMITEAGDVKVLDFGIARSEDALPDTAEPETPAVPGTKPPKTSLDLTPLHTHQGAILGTVGYMSPEQASGAVATPASDMYAFGLLLQELFTGKPPYDRAIPQEFALELTRRGQTEAPEGLGADLTALINQLKSVAPSRRPTAIDALARLRWIVDTPKRRVRRGVVAALVLAAVLGAAKYTIDLRRERTAAVAAREDADRRRTQAEGLIGFMLGNLRPKLQQAGRLELLEDVGREATAYFNAVPASSLSGEELYRRSQAIYQIGQIRQAEGKLAEAAAAYRESVSIGQQAVARDPANGEWQLGLATGHFYLGEALRRSADLSGAMREYSAYRDTAQALVTREPANEKWQLELSYGHGAVAAVQEIQGQLPAALHSLELAQRIKEDLAAKKPGDIERQQAVANGHNRLGFVLYKSGELDAALRHYEQDLDIRRALVAQAPRNYALKSTLEVALSFVGRVYEDKGETATAAARYQSWQEVAADKAAFDPQNAVWQRDLAVAEAVRGGLFVLTGLSADGLRLSRQAVARLRPLVDKSPTSASLHRDLSTAELGLGYAALASGDVRLAASESDAVVKMLDPLAARGFDLETSQKLADAGLLGGDAAARRNDAAGARRLREAALAAMNARPEVQSDVRSSAIRARALLALGRLDEARPLVERLLQRGYRHPRLMAEWRSYTR